MDSQKPPATPPASPASSVGVSPPTPARLPMRTAPLPSIPPATMDAKPSVSPPAPPRARLPASSPAATPRVPAIKRVALPMPSIAPLVRVEDVDSEEPAPSPPPPAVHHDAPTAPSALTLPTPLADGWVPLSAVPSASEVVDHLITPVDDPVPVESHKPPPPPPASLRPRGVAAVAVLPPSALLTQAITLPPPRPVSLTLPPSPLVRRTPRPPANWRVIARLTGGVFAAVALLVGVAWAYQTQRVPEGIHGVSLEADVFAPTLPSRIFTTGLGVERAPLPVLRRAPRPGGAVATHDAAMNARMAALPPPRRSTMPTPASAPVDLAPTVAHVIVPAVGQSCGERCAGDVDCLLACRPRTANVGSGGLATSVPSGEQLHMAEQSVRGAVMVCGMSLPGGAPSTIHVQVTFNASGSIARAAVGSPYSGTPVGDCVGRAIERARVPAFTQSSYAASWTLPVH